MKESVLLLEMITESNTKTMRLPQIRKKLQKSPIDLSDIKSSNTSEVGLLRGKKRKYVEITKKQTHETKTAEPNLI